MTEGSQGKGFNAQRCQSCGKRMQWFFGAAGWHRRNDPPEGYCECGLRKAVERFRALRAQGAGQRRT